MPKPVQAELLPFKVRDKRVSGWHWEQNELIDRWAPVIGAYGVAIYNVLSRFSRDNEVEGLSAARIARLLKMSRTKVFEVLRQMEDFGLLGRRSKPGGESTILLADLKAPPVRQADGLEDGYPSATRTGPVRHTDGYMEANPSATRTRPVRQGDWTRPPGGLAIRKQDSRLKTTHPPSPRPLKEVGGVEDQRRGKEGLVPVGDVARELLRRVIPEGEGEE